MRHFMKSVYGRVLVVVRAPRLLGDRAAGGAVDALHRRRQSNALRRLARQGGPRGVDGRRHRAEGRHPHRQLQRREHRRSRGEGNAGRPLQHLLHANRRGLHSGRQHREAEAPHGCLRRRDGHRLDEREERRADRRHRAPLRDENAEDDGARAAVQPADLCVVGRRVLRGREGLRAYRPQPHDHTTLQVLGHEFDFSQIFTYAGSGYDSFFGIVSDSRSTASASPPPATAIGGDWTTCPSPGRATTSAPSTSAAATPAAIPVGAPVHARAP